MKVILLCLLISLSVSRMLRYGTKKSPTFDEIQNKMSSHMELNLHYSFHKVIIDLINYLSQKTSLPISYEYFKSYNYLYNINKHLNCNENTKEKVEEEEIYKCQSIHKALENAKNKIINQKEKIDKAYNKYVLDPSNEKIIKKYIEVEKQKQAKEAIKG